jgi:hypothetical protein
MSELDLVRGLFPDRTADDVARERVRAAVAAHAARRPRRLPRRRLVPAVGSIVAAGAAAAAAIVLLGGTSATVSASAARLLHQAARAARHDRAVATLEPGQYLYTKSVDAYLGTTAGTRPDGTTWEYSVLLPTTREIWLGRDETGWLHETGGEPTWLSERDRQAWIAAGRPDLASGPSDTRLAPGPGATGEMTSLHLPSEPDALYAALKSEAEGNGNGTYEEMYTLIGDALRENYTTPAQRAALYEVAARLPGIELAGRTVDSAGRPALAVGMVSGDQHARSVLLFDPTSYALLGEQTTVLAGNSAGYPAGTVVGHATYLEQRVVDRVPAAVVNAAKN